MSKYIDEPNDIVNVHEDPKQIIEIENALLVKDLPGNKVRQRVQSVLQKQSAINSDLKTAASMQRA